MKIVRQKSLLSARALGFMTRVGFVAFASAAMAHAAEWKALFDGNDLAAWKVYAKPADTR
jgi:hypothetical protein